MKKNMGSLDRLLRIGIAVVIGVLYMMGQLTGLAATILGVLAVIFVATSFVGTCPLYLPFGLSTQPRTKAADSA